MPSLYTGSKVDALKGARADVDQHLIHHWTLHLLRHMHPPRAPSFSLTSANKNTYDPEK